MALSGSAKDLKPLFDEIKKGGFKIVPAGKHHKIVDVEGRLGAKGKVVTDDKGPLIVSSTPGDFRARDMHVKRLMGAKVIKRDPWAVDKGEGKDERGEGRDPEAVAKRRETIANEARKRTDRTKELRARIEPIITKLGGWSRDGMTAELGRTAFVFLKANDNPACWKSEAGATQNARQLRLGNTLSDQAVTAWSLFADELEKAWRPRAGGVKDDEALRRRYFDMVRAWKDVPLPEPAKQKEEETVEEPARREPTPPPEERVRLHPRGVKFFHGEDEPDEEEKEAPLLALRAVYLMAQGTNGASANLINEVMEVGEQILRLEMASQRRGA